MATVDPVDELLTPAEVAEMFGVNSKTVARWADSGRLGFIRTRVDTADSVDRRSPPCSPTAGPPADQPGRCSSQLNLWDDRFSPETAPTQ